MSSYVSHTDSCFCYGWIPVPSIIIATPDVSCALVNAPFEIVQHVITGTHGERDDRHRGGLVGATRKNACVANVEIGNIVGLRPFVRNELLGIVSKSADAGFVQAGSGTIGLIVGAPQFSPHRLEKIDHHLLRVFPHQQFVLSPLKMKAKLGNAEDVFLFRIDVDVVGGAGQSRRLNEGADGRRVVALDIALELRAKTFNLPVVSWEPSTTAAHVHGIAANELLFAWIL